MPQDTSDSAALKALSKPEDQKFLAKARATINTDEVGKAFQVLHSFYAAKSTAALPIDGLETLVKYRMTGAAEFVFLKSASELRGLNIDELLRVAASAKCVSAWIGKGEDSIAREAALIARFKGAPLEALSTALAVWFFECAPPKQMRGGLDVFLLDSEKRLFTAKDALLKFALSRDRDGSFLGSLIAACGRSPEARDRVILEIKNHDELVELFVTGVPNSIQTAPSEAIAVFVGVVFNELLAAKSPARKRWWSAQLLSLAAGLLLLPACEVSVAVLDELDRLSLLAEDRPSSGEVDRDVCVIRYHGVSRTPVQPTLTLEAAQLIALTLAKIRNGDDPNLSLEATALNLGMERIATLGATVEYNPKFHEDMAGGLSPDTQAIVLDGGWQYKGKLIQRAQVKPI